ncbi:LysR substrate-binding domain-containing protein [Roseomonas sp. USHLN139]|uniref:LysR substrate-binding domain-containing protein n=1 Tax=Roseomonas sp. USHLN139 TaxID=3081298 RepID=UPI003B01F54F
MQWDLADLRLFLAVAEAGSITGGAARANLALAAASARLRGLEARIGTKLLERHRRGAALTPAGQALLHHARRLQGQIAAMQGELSAYAGGLAGQIRLPANSAACEAFLPEVLGRFVAAHPRLDVVLEERPSHAIVRAVAEGAAELGIAAGWAVRGLESAFFARDRLVAVVPSDRVLDGPVSLAALAGESWIGLAEGSALQEHLAAQGVPRLRLRLGGLDAVCRAVAAGGGVAVVPELVARRFPVGVVALLDDWAVRELFVVARSVHGLSPAGQALWRQLTEGAWGNSVSPDS